MTLPIPAISFIIPAYNAADTLEVTLRSLQAQTRPNWQAVIVDDGSTDTTYEVAQNLAMQDSRIKVVTRANGGVSAARNTGVDAADAAYICLLDADDWLDRRYVEKMLPPLKGRTTGVATHCAFSRLVGDEMVDTGLPPDLSGNNARREISRNCVLAVFCVVFAKADYLAVGGSNTTRRTSEDWELWQKLAFTGIEFIRVSDRLGVYNTRAGSLSGDMNRVAQDSLNVLESGRQLTAKHDPDELAETRNARFNLAAALNISWCIGWRVAQDLDGEAILTMISPLPNVHGHERSIAQAVVHGLSFGNTIHMIKSLPETYQWRPRIKRLFNAFEAAGTPGMARHLWTELVARVVQLAPPAAPWTLDHICAFSVDIHQTPAVPRPDGVDTAVVALMTEKTVLAVDIAPMWGDYREASLAAALEQRPRLRLETLKRQPLALAAFTLRVSIDALQDGRTLARICFRETGRRQKLKSRLAAIFKRNLAPVILADSTDGVNIARSRIAGLRGDLTPAGLTNDFPARSQSSHLSTEGCEYWENLFATPSPWNYLSAYETQKYEQTLELVDREPVGRAIEIACAEGIFTQMLAPKVGHLHAVDISTRALERAANRCEAFDNIEFSPLNLIEEQLPANLDLILCSEVLYYIGDAHRLVPIAAKFADALCDDGRFITAHAHMVVDEPHRTGFDWGSPFGAATIREVFSATPGLVLEETLDTELYAIHVFRKTSRAIEPRIVQADYGRPLDADVARYLIRDGQIMSRDRAMAAEQTLTVPVLMYHRIADRGPEALADWRVPPDQFDAQLNLLRRHGYYAITSATLTEHIRTRRPLPGRPVLITFDDAYQDFADTAFPIIERNDFVVELFVVTDKVGLTSDWDAQYGPPAPLMGWEDIGRLSRNGVRFGSHLASHTPAPQLSSDALLDEAARSMLAIEQHTGQSVTSIALPHGLYDSRVETTLAICGYESAFSTDYGFANLDDRLLRLPRLHVSGRMTIAQFATMLGIKS